MERLTIAEALRNGIAEEMERDDNVFCLGEDIGVPGGWGGAFTVTLGLEERFPDRILNTPIAEAGFFGAAIGAAMMGMRSIEKTGRALVVEEGPKTGGVGAELAAGITERFGEYLLAPVERVASPDVPVPFAPELEDLYRPDVARIIEAARRLTSY